MKLFNINYCINKSEGTVGIGGDGKRYCILSYKVLILAIICCFINANAQAAPILKLNSHGHDVIVLQQNLIRMNYDLSKVSGNYDKETQEAVKAFQKIIK